MTPHDDPLDRMLRAGRDDDIADDGFTDRVMASLPPPIAAPSWRRPAVVALWLVAGSALALVAPGAALDLARGAYRVVATVPVSLSGMAVAVVAALAVTAGAAAWSLQGSD
jgi:hypothetical protein